MPEALKIKENQNRFKKNHRKKNLIASLVRSVKSFWQSSKVRSRNVATSFEDPTLVFRRISKIWKNRLGSVGLFLMLKA